MRGICTIDRQPGSGTIAVWITGRADITASHTNAVVIDVTTDPDAMEKVRSLSRCCVVLSTEGTKLDGLPIDGDPLTRADVSDLLTEAEESQRRILDAITAYKRRTRSNSLVEPTFPPSPSLNQFKPETDEPSARAFATANYVRSAWTVWLSTDEERRRRTVQPRTGTSPWIMPEEMNGSTVPDFPARFASRLREQELV
jgi:hypothetical protein